MGVNSEAELLNCLPPQGRHAWLDNQAVKRLVRKMRPGVVVPALLEKRGSVWRLRFAFHHPDGRRLRRGVTLPDQATAEWVRDYLAKARKGEVVERRKVD
jgi:hypothetical protein